MLSLAIIILYDKAMGSPEETLPIELFWNAARSVIQYQDSV